MPASDQGIQAGSRYQLVPRTLIFVTCQDMVLLIRGNPQKRLWANLYNGIGGHVERGESIVESARRELIEETGISLPGLRLVGVISVDSGENPGVGIFVLRGELDVEDMNTVKPTQATDEGNLEWAHVDRLARLPLVADLFELIPKVLQSNSGDAPFFAVYSYDDQDRLQIRFT
jgi:8-oxo-dGTP diphosphatase